MTAAYVHGHLDASAQRPFAGYRQYRRNAERLDYGEGFTDALLEKPIRTGSH